MPEQETIKARCRICTSSGDNKLYKAREMFFGTREQFNYFECSNCSTLQIQNIPDLQRFYPQDYYSYKPPDNTGDILHMKTKERIVRTIAANYYGSRRNPLGKYLVNSRDWLGFGFPEYIKNTSVRLGITTKSRILDVGCGSGRELLQMQRFLFTNLTGADPYIASDIHYKNGVKVLKAEVSDLNGRFDLIMMHHSFEHIPDPQQTLEQIHRLLKKGKYVIICIPLASYAWNKYGTNWVQLDAPRHLYIFNEKSFITLAEEAGFTVDEVMYDSTDFQFWGSEQYALDIPLIDDRSHAVNPEKSIFSKEQIDEFLAQAKELNSRKEGDQAIFYLRKR